MNPTRCFSVVATLLFTALSHPVNAQGRGESHPHAAVAAHWFPSTTLVYAEFRNPVSWINTIYDHPLRDRIKSLDAFRTAMSSPQAQQFQAGRNLLELQLQMTWRRAVEQLADDGVAVGYDPTSRGFAVILLGQDTESTRTLVNQLLRLVENVGSGTELRQGEYRGIQAYQTNDLRIARVDQRLLITNRSELGKKMIDLMLDGGVSLNDSPQFQQAIAGRVVEDGIWAFANVEAFRKTRSAGVLEQRIENVAAELLVGALHSNLQHTGYLAGEATLDQRRLTIRVASPHQNEWIPEEREYLHGRNGNGRAPDFEFAGPALATLTTYRDFSEFWLRAGDLFDESIVDGFAQADANLTTLFAGRDFGEDILGAIEPGVGLIVTRPEVTDRLPRPTIKLPQFALAMTLRDPDTMSRELRRTFQSLIGFLNIIGAMEGRNQLELGMEQLLDGGELVSATFVPEQHEQQSDEASLLFNFSPTIGFQDNRFVLASTTGLARQLLSDGNWDQTSHANTQLEINATELRAALAINRNQLIAQNMLEDGNSRDEAEAVIDVILEVIGFFESLSLSHLAADNVMETTLALSVKP